MTANTIIRPFVTEHFRVGGLERSPVLWMLQEMLGKILHQILWAWPILCLTVHVSVTTVYEEGLENDTGMQPVTLSDFTLQKPTLGSYYAILSSGLLGYKVALQREREQGLRVLTLGSNSWQTLIADALVLHFSYNPRNNSMYAVVRTRYLDLTVIKRAYFNAAERETEDSLKVKLARDSCPQSIHTGFESTPSKQT